ncbi:hypothetical protein JAAARDRAFT_123166 [Jaapia argillacea MUCL 33604]|uniref:Uncharacterized protein n=1 Tax=Jaapia argillacea MUCL 33604 TaxID=933084 RepID=A0A067QDK6_9AGAM|nr:hypothetical protein JAAARDRAFT_123166 [Jaapia argillacea MUCL 33604]
MDPNLVPQKMYRPQTSSDRRRYIDEVRFDPPIYFGRDQLHGVPLNEILNGNGQIYNGSEEVFKNCGPSISIRINWRGYEPWSKQIPTKNWKNPPGPITRQKLAKQVARRIEEFVDCMKSCEMDEEADQRWRVGSHGISVSNLTLVSLHHVSKGSWQPQLRVIR